MSSVVLSGDTSGAITLSAPSVAGTNTITLPASTGTVMVNGPAFSAYLSSTQSVSNATNTKVQLNSEDFDTASCFDSTTNYRFTPNVAGYYQINATAYFSSMSTTASNVGMIYKNGSQYKWLYNLYGSAEGSGSIVVYLNGSTDYVEFYVYQNSGGSLNLSASSGSPVASYTHFSGAMIRSA